jgi:hypothetical protein
VLDCSVCTLIPSFLSLSFSTIAHPFNPHLALFIGTMEWFTPHLHSIATLASLHPDRISLHISVYVTCLCNPEAVPDIPNLDATIVRPDVRRVLEELVTAPSAAGDESGDEKGIVGAANDAASSEVPKSLMDIEAIPRTPLSPTGRPPRLASTPTPSSSFSSDPVLLLLL